MTWFFLLAADVRCSSSQKKSSKAFWLFKSKKIISVRYYLKYWIKVENAAMQLPNPVTSLLRPWWTCSECFKTQLPQSYFWDSFGLVSVKEKTLYPPPKPIGTALVPWVCSLLAWSILCLWLAPYSRSFLAPTELKNTDKYCKLISRPLVHRWWCILLDIKFFTIKPIQFSG